MPTQTTPDILSRIIERKRLDVAEARRLRPETRLLEQLDAAPPVRDFIVALRSASDIGLIAEVK